MGFMVLFSTALNSQFQRKNQFWKSSTESWDIVQNMSKFGHFAQNANFWHLFTDISRLTASFLNPIDALKPWVQAGRKEYHEPHKRNKIFFYL